MILFPNATLKVAGLSITKNAEGTKIKSFDFDNPIATFRADVQPNSLSQYQIELYGIDSKNAETKKVFFDSSIEGMVLGNRVEVIDDDGNEKVYRIQPLNRWRIHSEALLIPVENE